MTHFKTFSLVFILLTGLLIGCGSETTITILHFNDFHEQVHPVQVKVDGKEVERGGLDRLVGGLKAAKATAGPNSLVLFGGDMLQGTPFSTFFKGEVSYGVLESLIDYMVPGVHEFDYGQENLINLVNNAKFELLTANIVDRDAKPFLGDEYVIKDIDGIKVGIFGLTVRITEILQSAKAIEGLNFLPVEDRARAMVSTLRNQGAEIVIALTHLGFEEDKKLARAVDGIDLIVGALSHTVLTNGFLVFDTWIAQAGYRGERIGKVEIKYDKEKKNLISVTPRLIDVGATTPADPEVTKLVDEYSKELKTKLDVVVSTTEVLLEGSRNIIRGTETNLGNLIADLMKEETGSDMCIINSGVIRTSIEPGPIKVADILNVLPYPNNVSTVRIPGRAIIRILEKSAATNPGEGRFMQISRGLKFKIRGRTMLDLTFHGQPLEENRYYTVATSDFLADGGDNYPEFGEDKDPKNTGIIMSEFMINALRKIPVINQEAEGRIVRLED